ncbi:MAG: cache domain-containing protein, partial [Pseudomonadota bacterium]
MKNRSLNFKLLAGGALCVLLPLLALQIVLNFRLTADIKAESEHNTINIAKSLSDLTHSTVAGEVKLVKDLAVGNTTIDVAAKVAEAGIAASSDDIQRLDRKLISAMKVIGEQYETIIVCDTEGTVYADSLGGSHKGISVKDRAYFQDAKAGKIHPPTPVKSKATGNPILPICTPILSSSGKFIGALTIMLKMEYLAAKILEIKVGKTGYPFIVNRNGIVIVHPDPKFILEL